MVEGLECVRKLLAKYSAKISLSEAPENQNPTERAIPPPFTESALSDKIILIFFNNCTQLP